MRKGKTVEPTTYILYPPEESQRRKWDHRIKSTDSSEHEQAHIPWDSNRFFNYILKQIGGSEINEKLGQESCN